MNTVNFRNFDTFIYDHFDIEYKNNSISLKYFYEIVGLKNFVHTINIPITRKNINENFVKQLAFNIGMIELVSYYKATVSQNIIVKCGNLTNEQKEFFKKIYYHGLGEFFYRNNLNPSYDDFVTITCFGKTYDEDINENSVGSLIAVGGGKDSCVTLSLIPKDNNMCFIINPKEVTLSCAKVAGYTNEEICKVERILDKELINLNNEGFLNGHTPFSAMLAFVSYLSAYLNEKQNIILSNEASANEANVLNTKINHQYSKSYEFESDFQNYAKKYLKGNINYFSFLRPLAEYQIGMLFAKIPEYHNIFKSCNVGSKNTPWIWCGNCAKCLFVYSLLSPFLYKDDLIKIFNKDLFEDETLLETFKELLGKSSVKPFDCVGTFEEINYAITKTIKKLNEQNLPYLLRYYYENYYDEEILKLDLEHAYNNENSLEEKYEAILKGALGL